MTIKKNLLSLYEWSLSQPCFRFVTVSPPYSCDDPDSIVDTFMDCLIKYRRLFTCLIGNVEIGSNERVHFHIVYNFNDARKHYYFINKALRGLKWNVLCVDKPPIEGYEYLIKEEETVSSVINRDALYSLEDVIKLYSYRKEQRKVAMLSRKNHHLDDGVDKAIPKCFLREGDESD